MMVAIPVPPPATTRAIFAALEAQERNFRSNRLGAASIGEGCARRLWDNFRWLFAPEHIAGQKASIFKTGHLWEDRLIEMMRGAGIVVHDRDPETTRQFSRTFAGGHGVCKVDGVAEKLPEAPKTPHVLEIKTHKDESFKELLKNGVSGSKPTHHAQVQVGMAVMGLTRALYLAVNKNDDSLYAERIEYDPVSAARLMVRAESIVTSDRRPPCSCAPYLIKAGYGCSVNEGAMPVRTCRSCLHATAHLDGDARWSCARFGRDLSLDEQKAACPSHLFNPTTVPGEQTDCDEAGEWVLYRMADGSVWRDGGRT